VGVEMNKEDFLKQIAESAYNVGYGAKKHFATYDIVEKTPGWIGFLSISIGILALFLDVLSTKLISSILIIFGIVGLYIGFYGDKNEEYNKAGKYLTGLFNELKELYFKAKSSGDIVPNDDLDTLKSIESRYHKRAISKQILFSDWYAHYKFFWQHQIDWISEQKKFGFWRDKMPLSLTIILLSILIGIVAFYWGEDLISFINTYVGRENE
jgi:uncharacterized membrane protein